LTSTAHWTCVCRFGKRTVRCESSVALSLQQHHRLLVLKRGRPERSEDVQRRACGCCGPTLRLLCVCHANPALCASSLSERYVPTCPDDAQHFQQHLFTKAQTTHCRREYTAVTLSPFESIISETFEAREQYGVPVYISRSPLLSDYVRDTVSSFREWLLQVSNTIYTI
jgi:hypothetical protein